VPRRGSFGKVPVVLVRRLDEVAIFGGALCSLWLLLWLFGRVECKAVGYLGFL
jgi:hypothetical protein